MGFFNRSKSAPQGSELPSDVRGKMERVARHALDPNSQDFTAEQEAQMPLYPLATSDPARFLEALLTHTSSAGNLAAYGAAITAFNLLLPDQRTGSTYDAILKGAAAAARAMNLSASQIAPFIAAAC